jgi:hypothetical protein
MCNKPTSMVCKQCGNSSYCSQACQRADWPVHKLLCAQFKDFQNPPSPFMRRAIWFPENEPDVKFIWVPVTRISSEDGDDDSVNLKTYFADTAELKPEFRGYQGNGRPLIVNVNALRGNRRLGSAIDIRHRETALIDGSKRNQAVFSATKGRSCHEWRGPIVVLKQKKNRVAYDTCSFCDDMDVAGLRDVVDYFTGYGAQGLGWWARNKDPE